MGIYLIIAVVVAAILLYVFRDRFQKVMAPNKIDLEYVKDEDMLTIYDKYIEAMGGPKNIERINSCSTRIRILLKDDFELNNSQLEEIGVKKIIKLSGKKYQLVVGKKASKIAEHIVQTLDLRKVK